MNIFLAGEHEPAEHVPVLFAVSCCTSADLASTSKWNTRPDSGLYFREMSSLVWGVDVYTIIGNNKFFFFFCVHITSFMVFMS